jgi:hypothetical protein
MKIRYFACASMFLLVSLLFGCGGGGGGGGSSSGPTADTTPPTVSITSPASNASVSGTVAITASASDNVGVSKVEFYVNGSLQTTVTASPYTFSWDTSSLSSGTYSLTAKAYDAANNSTTSSAVSIAVNGAKTGPATATFTLNIPTLPASTLVAGVQFVLTLPSGVLPASGSGSDASGSITLINGGANLQSLSAANYDSTANTIKFVGVTTTGFGTGDFAIISCVIPSGTSAAPSGFTLSDIQVYDTGGNQISATITMSALLL